MTAMAQVSDFKPYTGDDDLTRADKSASRASLASADEAYSQAILLTCAAFTRLSSGCRHFHSGQPVKQCAASQAIPDLDEYTKEPPPLPPHLRHIILNKAPPVTDACALPTPHHVALNHLYCTAIKDGVMVLGITQRHRQKSVTTVYYSMMN